MRYGDGPVDVLLVEDHPGDVRLTKEAFHHSGTLKLWHVWDGVEALAFLRQETVYIDAPRPHLVMLDLNLPKLDGREVLAQIKSDLELRTIPIIVLTANEAEIDISLCYGLGANCYLQKPVHWDDFENLIRYVNRFWLARPNLPPSVHVS